MFTPIKQLLQDFYIYIFAYWSFPDGIGISKGTLDCSGLNGHFLSSCWPLIFHNAKTLLTTTEPQQSEMLVLVNEFFF